MNFQRTRNTKEALNLGGYSLETLKPYAILRVKENFGITIKGKLGNYDKCGCKIRKDDFFIFLSKAEKSKVIMFLHYPNKKTHYNNITYKRNYNLKEVKKSKKYLINNHYECGTSSNFIFIKDIYKLEFNEILEVIDK